MIKNKIIAAAALTLLAIVLLLPLAAAGGTDLSRVPVGRRLPRFIDDVGLLTREEARILTDKLDEISERHRFDTVVAVVRTLDWREARLYAVDFFEQNGFGFGYNLDGAILLLATRDRDFGFASLGFGLRAFTPAGQEYLDKLFVPHLKNDDYYEAFLAFADAVDDFLTNAKAGAPYDSGNIPLTDSERAEYQMYAIVISLVLAFIIAYSVTRRWRRQLISVRKEDHAHVYIREGSMVLTAQGDVFLHRHVQRVRRVEKDSGGSGGGSSFTSSSGRSATGHSGKY